DVAGALPRTPAGLRPAPGTASERMEGQDRPGPLLAARPEGARPNLPGQGLASLGLRQTLDRTEPAWLAEARAARREPDLDPDTGLAPSWKCRTSGVPSRHGRLRLRLRPPRRRISRHHKVP